MAEEIEKVADTTEVENNVETTEENPEIKAYEKTITELKRANAELKKELFDVKVDLKTLILQQTVAEDADLSYYEKFNKYRKE